MTGRQFMIGTLVLVAMIMLLLLVKEPRHGADPIRETVTLNQYIQALETEAWTVRDITRFHVEGADSFDFFAVPFFVRFGHRMHLNHF